MEGAAQHTRRSEAAHGCMRCEPGGRRRTRRAGRGDARRCGRARPVAGCLCEQSTERRSQDHGRTQASSRSTATRARSRGLRITPAAAAAGRAHLGRRLWWEERTRTCLRRVERRGAERSRAARSASIKLSWWLTFASLARATGLNGGRGLARAARPGSGLASCSEICLERVLPATRGATE